ncbi:MAG: glycosyltransferase family 4 protein [Chthoniobacteraceae bacterium]
MNERIALLANEYPPGPHGGIGSFTTDLAEGLAGKGCAVDVIVAQLGAPRREPAQCRDEASNPRVWDIALSSPRWMRWRPGAVWQRWQLRSELRRLHRIRRFQLVECIDNSGLLPFGGIPGIPSVVRLHGATFFYDAELGSMTSDRFTHWLEKRTLDSADHLVGVSRFVAEGEMRRAGKQRPADRVIYNAVDAEHAFRPDASVSREDGLIVFANAIHPRKGVNELCAAMNGVMERFPNARLVLIGRIVAGDAERRETERALVESVKPVHRARITFTGGLSRIGVRDWIARAHLCCYPSKLESFGLAPVEAMAMGKPTIYSRTGAGPEVIEDGVSGLLCDPADSADIAEKICAILGDRELAESLGANGRRRAVELFDRRQWIDRNLDFYRHCLQRVND